MHAFYVHLEFLWLTEFPAAKVAQRSGTLRIRCTTVGPMHFQIVEAQEVLLAELTLIRTLAVVQLQGMPHNVGFAENGGGADLTMILTDGQTVAGIMEDGTVCAIEERMIELDVAATAI